MNSNAPAGSPVKSVGHLKSAGHLGMLALVSMALSACGQGFTDSSAVVPTATSPSVTMRTQAVPAWQLVYADEFNGLGLDASKWIVTNGAVTVNNELEYYTPEDVYLQGGNLVLRSQKRAYGGKNYTSGEVRTGNNVTVSRGSAVEWRTKVPKGKGIWPADWLVNTPCDGLVDCAAAWPPEIDVMEMRGSQPNVNLMTHWWGINPAQQFDTTPYTGPDYSLDFHTYRVEWFADKIVWYIDGVVRATHTANITSGTMQLIMNTAVGGNFDGAPDASTVFPQYQLIDYVRVYKDSSSVVSTAPVVPTDRFVQIVNKSSNKCLDVRGGPGGTAENTPLSQYPCLGTAQTNQFFKFVPTDSGYYLMQAQHSGKIMAVTGASQNDGAPINQWTWGPGSLDSQWQPVDVGGGYFKLVARHSNKVMDLPYCSTDDVDLKQVTDYNNDCQKFRIR